MKKVELIESCKKAIEEGRCLGCTGLEDEKYQGNPNCEYLKESLGVQENLWKNYKK